MTNVHSTVVAFLCALLILQPTTAHAEKAPSASSAAPTEQTSPAPKEAPVLQSKVTVSSPLTLEAAIAIATSHYPSIRVAAAQIAAAQGQVDVAKVAYMPRSDFFWQNNWATANQQTGLFFPMPGLLPVAGGHSSQNWQTGFGNYGGLVNSWTVYDFGYRKARLTAAKTGESVAQTNQKLTEFDVVAATANAFLQAVTAQSLVKTAEADFKRFRVLLTIVSTLVKSGLRPGADQSRALADVAQSETRLIQARQQAKLGLIQLAHTLGMAGEEISIDAEPFLTSPPERKPINLDIVSHPAVQAEVATIQQIREEKAALSKSFLPKLNVLGGIMSRGSGFGDQEKYLGGLKGTYPNMMNFALAMTVNWTPSDIFDAHAKDKVAQANIDAEKAKYDELIEQLKTADAQSVALTESATAIAEHTPIQVEAAKMANLQVTQRYRAGLATLVDVAEAQKVLTQAEVDDSLAKLGVWSAYLGCSESKGSLQPFMSLVHQYQSLHLDPAHSGIQPESAQPATTGEQVYPTTLTPSQLNPGQPNPVSLSPVLVKPNSQNMINPGAASQNSLELPSLNQSKGAPLSPEQLKNNPQIESGVK